MVIVVNSIYEQGEKIFFSISDTISYCESLGIKLNRKSIKKSFLFGEKHIRLIFKYIKHEDKYLHKISLLLNSLYYTICDSLLFISIVFLSITAIVYGIHYPLVIEHEANGSMFDDITITRDLSDLLDVKPSNIKLLTVESKANLEL